MTLQVKVHEVIKPDEAELLREQLNGYLEYRNHFATPSDYMQAGKVFTTELLGSIHSGMDGKIAQCGNGIETCLKNIPPGVHLGKLEDALWKLRRYCKHPQDAEENGVDLPLEFEHLH